MSREAQTMLGSSPATAEKAAKTLATLALAALLTGCGRQVVCPPVSPRPDFQKAVVMRCVGGDVLVDTYLSGFQEMTTSERIEFVVAMSLAPCPAEVTEWLKEKARTAPKE